MFAQLEAAYDHRDQLWLQLEQDLTQCGINSASLCVCSWFNEENRNTLAERARAAVEALPADIEETIARLEKKSKGMERKEKKSVSNQQMLRDLVERM